VELIVLNIGLQAKILDPRVFAMFVIEALVLTFMTTPLTLLVYPPKYRTLHSANKAKEGEEAREEKPPVTGAPGFTGDSVDMKLRIMVMLHKLEHISPLMTMTQLLGPSVTWSNTNTATSNVSHPAPPSVEVSQAPNAVVSSSRSQTSLNASTTSAPTLDALRLMDLSERTSAVMYGSVTTELLYRDPLVAALRTFARLHRIPVASAALSVVPQDEFPSKVCERANEVRADLILLPWNTSLHPVMEISSKQGAGEGTSYNPFEGMFGKSGNPSNAVTEKPAAVIYANFVRRVFSMSTVDVALFIESEDQVTSSSDDFEDKKPLTGGHHLFLPYFGGPDDRLALNLVIQLCANSNGSVQATIIRMTKTEPDVSPTESKPLTGEQNEAANMITVQSVSYQTPYL
jgi:hypothetical protein